MSGGAGSCLPVLTHYFLSMDPLIMGKLPFRESKVGDLGTGSSVRIITLSPCVNSVFTQP